LIITRRSFCGFIAAAGVMSRLRPAAAEQPVTVKDMVGRRVHLPALPERIVLLEGHDILTMSLLHPDPSSLVVGWAAADRIDSEHLRDRLLNGRSVEIVGKLGPDTLSLEGLVALAPDLVVTTSFMTPNGDADPLVERLTRFGIPVVFSDASSNAGAGGRADYPVAEIEASMKMWGELLGATVKADAFVSFFKRELARVDACVAGAPGVTTYLEVQSTPDDCCWAAGGRIWGELLSRAGGVSLPGVTAPWYEKISLEHLLSTPHEVYIASGGGWSSGSRPAIGPGIDARLGRGGLQRLIDGRPGFGHLASVREKRVHGIWTGLITSLPLNLLFVTQAAKWLHPERCAGLDPQHVLDAINRDFAAFPIEGPLWVSL
jgi:iron complex transport system substrate-binding protein